MNLASHRYALLMASLTAHEPDLFGHRQAPVSAFQLNKRLAWLSFEHAEQLRAIRRVLDWSEVGALSDAAFIQSAQSLLDRMENDFLKTLIAWRLELRTLVAAVRHKHHQPDQAMAAGNLVLTAFGRDILANWRQDDFGLRHRFPWLVEVNRLIRRQHYWALEKFLMNLAWRYYERQSQGHYFDFEAVVIYVLRWELRHRLIQNEGLKARQRFVELLQQQVEEVV